MPFSLSQLNNLLFVFANFGVSLVLLASATLLLPSNNCFASNLIPFFLLTMEHYHVWVLLFVPIRQYHVRYVLSPRSKWLVSDVKRFLKGTLAAKLAETRLGIVVTERFRHCKTKPEAQSRERLDIQRSPLQRRFARPCGQNQKLFSNIAAHLLFILGIIKAVSSQEITDPIGFGAASEDGSGLTDSIKFLHFYLPFDPQKADCNVFTETSLQAAEADVHAADNERDMDSGTLTPSLIVRAFVEVMAGQRQPSQDSVWGSIDFTGVKPNPANMFVVKSGWAPHHLMREQHRKEYLLAMTGKSSFEEAESFITQSSYIPIVVKSWVDPVLGSDMRKKWNIYGNGLSPIDGRHSEFAGCGEDRASSPKHTTVTVGALNKCALTVRDTFGNLAPLLVSSRRLVDHFESSFQVVLSSAENSFSPLAQDVILRTATSVSPEILGEVSLSFHLQDEDIATALGDFSTDSEGRFIVAQTSQRLKLTFAYLGQPIGSMLPQDENYVYSPSGGIVKTAILKIDEYGQRTSLANSILTSTLRFGSQRPPELTVEVLSRLDVREVLAAAIARGLGLSSHVHVFVVRVLNCGIEECENGYSDRRRNRRQLYRHQTSQNIDKTGQRVHHRRLGSPSPSPSPSPSHDNRVSRSSYSYAKPASLSSSNNISTTLMGIAASTTSSASSRFLSGLDDIEIVFEVVGPKSIVRVAQARLSGEPDPIIENATLPTWSVTSLALNISQSLESAHGDLPSLLGFVILPQTSVDEQNATDGDGSGRTIGELVTPESIDRTVPIEIDGEKLLPGTTPAPAIPPSPSPTAEFSSPSSDNKTVDLPSLPGADTSDSSIATAVISTVIILLILGTFLILQFLKKWRLKKRREMYTHYKIKRALRKKRQKLDALRKLKQSEEAKAHSISDQDIEETMKKEAEMALLLDIDLDVDNEDDVDLLLSELDPVTKAKLEEVENKDSDSDIESLSVNSLPSGLPSWLRWIEPCLMPSKRSARVMPDFEFFVPGQDGILVDNSLEARRRRAINADWMAKYRTISPYLYSVDAKGRPRKPDSAPIHPVWPPPPGLRRKQLENLRIYRRQLMSFEQAQKFNAAAKRLQRMWRHNRVWGYAMRIGLARISAARKIQRVWHGKKGRMRWRARFDLVDGLNRAALRLQLTWYRKSGMFSTFVLMRALWVLDTREKAAEHLLHLRARHSAAIFVQYRWRMSKRRRHRQVATKSCRCIQRCWRAYARSKEWRELRRELRLANRMAVRVQLCWYRRNGEFSTFVLMRCLTWHGDQQEIRVAKEIVVENQSARLLQRVWRGKLARRDYHKRKRLGHLPDYMQTNQSKAPGADRPEIDVVDKPAPLWMQQHLASKMERSIAEANYSPLPKFQKSQTLSKIKERDAPPSFQKDWQIPGHKTSRPGISLPTFEGRSRGFPVRHFPRRNAGSRGPPRLPPNGLLGGRGRPRPRPNFFPTSRSPPNFSRPVPRGKNPPSSHPTHVLGARSPPNFPRPRPSPRGSLLTPRALPFLPRGKPSTPRSRPPTPRGQTSPPRGKPPTPRSSRITPRGRPPPPRGKPSTPRGDSPIPRGRPPPPRGKPPTPRGSPPTSRGGLPTPRGKPPTPRGSPPTSRGRLPTPRGKPPTPRGSPPTSRGRPPPPRGKPPTPRGSPPTPRGRPPPPRGKFPTSSSSRGAPRVRPSGGRVRGEDWKPRRRVGPGGLRQTPETTIAVIEASRAADAAKQAAEAANTSRLAMEKRLKQMQSQLQAREKALLEMKREKEKHDLQLSNETNKRLETQRAVADARLLREQRRFEKMRATLEEERRLALKRVAYAEESKRLEAQRAAAIELEFVAEKSKVKFLEKEAARALELEEELLEREASIEQVLSEQKDEIEKQLKLEVSETIRDNEKKLLDQIAILSEARQEEKAAVQEAAREQAKVVAAQLARDEDRISALEEELRKKFSSQTANADIFNKERQKIEQERQKMTQARVQYEAKLRAERDAELAAIELKATREVNELRAKLENVQASNAEKEGILSHQMTELKVKSFFDKLQNNTKASSAAKQLAFAQQEKAKVEAAANLAEEKRKNQEEAALLAKEQLVTQMALKMNREMEEQRLILEEQIKHTLKEQELESMNAKIRMEAKISELEREKGLAIKLAKNNEDASSAKEKAISAINLAKAQMTASISQMEDEMNRKINEAQKQHDLLVVRQRQAQKELESKEIARQAHEKEEREKEGAKAKAAILKATEREKELEMQLRQMQLSFHLAEKEKEKHLHSNTLAMEEKHKNLMDSKLESLSDEKRMMEKAFAEKLETERLKLLEEQKSSDAILSQARLELERAKTERKAMQKATEARIKFAAAEAKWEREKEMLQIMRKRESELEKKMISRFESDKALWDRNRQKEKTEEARRVAESEMRLKTVEQMADLAKAETEKLKAHTMEEKASSLKREEEVLQRLSQANEQNFKEYSKVGKAEKGIQRRHSVQVASSTTSLSISHMSPEQILAIKLGPAPNPANKQAYSIYVRRLERRQRAEEEIKARNSRKSKEASSKPTRKKRIPLRERIAAARADRAAAVEMEESMKRAAAAREAVEAKARALLEKKKADARKEKLERQRSKASSITPSQNPVINVSESKVETNIREEKSAGDFRDFSTLPLGSVPSPLTARRPPATGKEEDEATDKMSGSDDATLKGKGMERMNRQHKSVSGASGPAKKQGSSSSPQRKRPKKSSSRRQSQKRKLAAMHKRMNRLAMRRIDPLRLKKASVRVQQWWRRALFGLRLRKQMAERRVAAVDIQRTFRGARGRYVGRKFMESEKAERSRLARIAAYEEEERRKEEAEAKEAEERRKNATQKHKEREERRKRRKQVRRLKGKVMDKIRQQVEEAVNVHRGHGDQEYNRAWKDEEQLEMERRRRKKKESRLVPGEMPSSYEDESEGDASLIIPDNDTKSTVHQSRSTIMLSVTLPTAQDKLIGDLDQQQEQQRKKNKISKHTSVSNKKVPSGRKPSATVMEYRRNMKQESPISKSKKEVGKLYSKNRHISSASDHSSYLSLELSSESDAGNSTKNKKFSQGFKLKSRSVERRNAEQQQMVSALSSIGATAELVNVNSRAMAAVQRGAVDTARIILIRAQELLSHDDATTTNIAASLRATTLNNLGTVCSKQGKHDESLGFALAAVAAAQQIPSGPLDKDGFPDLASDEAQERARCLALALHNLGVQQECLGDEEAAKDTFRRSKFIVQKALDAAEAKEIQGYAGAPTKPTRTIQNKDQSMGTASMSAIARASTSIAARQIEESTSRPSSPKQGQSSVTGERHGLVIRPAPVRTRIPTYGGATGNRNVYSRRPHRVALFQNDLSQVEDRVHQQLVVGRHYQDKFGRAQTGTKRDVSFGKLSREVTRQTKSMDTWAMEDDEN